MQKLIVTIMLICLSTVLVAKEINITKSKGINPEVIVSLFPEPMDDKTKRGTNIKILFNEKLQQKSIKNSATDGANEDIEKDINWIIGDNSIVLIDQNGNIKALKIGETLVQAEYHGKSSEQVKVTVEQKEELNTQPAATAQSVIMEEDISKEIILTGSDTDGDSLTYIVADQPVNGLLSGLAPNLICTPNANYTGSDSFTFKVNDGKVDSVPATVSITINAKAEVINGYTLPPEPDESVNNSTLLGIDSNDNGVRDDVERLIIIEEAKNPNFPKTHTVIALQYAWAWQKMIENPTIESRKYLEEASACRSYFIDKHTQNLSFRDYRKWSKAHASLKYGLEDKLFNTRERIKQRFAFNRACSGNIFKAKKAVLSACQTNIDMLGE